VDQVGFQQAAKSEALLVPSVAMPSTMNNTQNSYLDYLVTSLDGENGKSARTISHVQDKESHRQKDWNKTRKLLSKW